jgi:hypothetical protein
MAIAGMARPAPPRLRIAREQPVAVDARHGDVGEHDVRPPLLEDLDRFGRRSSDAGVRASRAEDVAEELAPSRARRRRRERGQPASGVDPTGRAASCGPLPRASVSRAGNVTVNVEPRPGPSLNAATRPAVADDDHPRQRQAEAEGRLIARHRTRLLAERLEDVRQETPARCRLRCR